MSEDERYIVAVYENFLSQGIDMQKLRTVYDIETTTYLNWSLYSGSYINGPIPEEICQLENLLVMSTFFMSVI